MDVAAKPWVGLDIPLHLQKRLQSLSVILVVGGFFVFGPACLALTIYLLTTRYWWISVGYFLWYIIDQYREVVGETRHDLFGKWIRNLMLWEYMKDYFPITLVKTCELDSRENYILGYHPHGVMTIGACTAFATDALHFQDKFPGTSTAFLSIKCWFYIPFLREVLLLLGMRSASSTNFANILDDPSRRGRCVVLAIGGFEEAIYQSPGSHAIVLSNRFGFVKKALMHGAHLVPVYAFGESELFLRRLAPDASFWRWVQDGVRMSVAAVAPKIKGRKMFNFALSLWPKREPIRIVVGRPLMVTQNPSPNAEEVLELHRRYCVALTDLFEQHKSGAGLPKNAHLEIM